MHVLIVLGGDAPDADLLARSMKEADYVIAADRGLEAFHAAGLMPDLIVGDMDSVSPQVLSAYEGRLPQRRLNCIKDDTDGVDALDLAIEQGAKRVTFLGALGGRLDHALANLMLLVRAATKGVQAQIIDRNAAVYLVRGEQQYAFEKDDIVSILPLGTAQGVTIRGCYYPLEAHTLTSEHPLGVSNVVTQTPITVSVEAGDLILFHYGRGA